MGTSIYFPKLGTTILAGDRIVFSGSGLQPRRLIIIEAQGGKKLWDITSGTNTGLMEGEELLVAISGDLHRCELESGRLSLLYKTGYQRSGLLKQKPRFMLVDGERADLDDLSLVTSSKWQAVWEAGTLKPGSGQALLSLDTALTEQRYRAQPTVELTPERLFERSWAEMILERAVKQVRDEFAHDGREFHFREQNAFLSAPAGAADYGGVAMRLQMTESGVAKTAERLPRRYRSWCGAKLRTSSARPPNWKGRCATHWKSSHEGMDPHL